MTQLTLKLDNYTQQIKEKEKQIVLNFVDIGKQLKEVRDEKIYKEKYSEFGDYINSSGFKFSEVHAYRMIAVYTEFSNIDVTKIGITKCIELLKLPALEREKVMQDNNVEDMSVREVSEVVEDKKVETEVEQEVQQSQDIKPIKVADKIDMLDKALSYLSEELDNVLNGMNDIQKPTYKKEYSENKTYFVSTFKKIDNQLLEVSNKLRKAKVFLKYLKRFRR